MKIVMIGAGNVGYHFGKSFFQQNHEILQVFSRSYSTAQELAKTLNASATDDLRSLNPHAHLYFIAVPDDIIPKIVKELSNVISEDAVAMHTSGMTSSGVFLPEIERHGVIWPVMSMSKSRDFDMSNVPLVITANDKMALKILKQISGQISQNVRVMSDSQRSVLHLAATFANNFGNHMFTLAEQILAGYQIEFEILRPIILETAHKIKELSPNQAQTGAAIRGDKSTIVAHLQLLKDNPDLKYLYHAVSESINRNLNLNKDVVD